MWHGLRNAVYGALLVGVLEGCASQLSTLRHLDPLSYQTPPPDCELLGDKYGVVSDAQARLKQWYACPDKPVMVEQTVYLFGTHRYTHWRGDRGRFDFESVTWACGEPGDVPPIDLLMRLIWPLYGQIPGPGESAQCLQTYGPGSLKLDGSIYDTMLKFGIVQRTGMYPWVFHPDEQRAGRIRSGIEGTCRISNQAGC